MAGAGQFSPHARSFFFQHLHQTGPVGIICSAQELFQDPEGVFSAAVQEPGAHFKDDPVRAVPVGPGIGIDRADNTACIYIDLIVEFRVAEAPGIHGREGHTEDAQIGEITGRHPADIKEQAQVMDLIGEQGMGNELPAADFTELVDAGLYFAGQVFSGQHGDGSLCLLCIRGLLPVAQGLFLINDGLLLFLCQGSRVSPHLLFELRLLLIGQTGMGLQDNDAAVGIVQQIFLHQTLEVTFLHLLPEDIKVFAGLQGQPGLLLIIEPGIEQAQAVDQAFGIAAEVGFPVAEFEIVDGGHQGLAVESVRDQSAQGLLDGGNELFFAFRIRIFGDHGEGRLLHAQLQQAVDVLSDPLVTQGFPDGRAFRVAEGIVQHFKGCDQLAVQAVLHQRGVPGQIAFAGWILIGHNGIFIHGFPDFRKGFLDADGGIDIDPVKAGQILPVQIGQTLDHVHVSVHIDKAVGRMIISAVEFQILLIGQVRDLVRVAAGFMEVGGIRIQAGIDLAAQDIISLG